MGFQFDFLKATQPRKNKASLSPLGVASIGFLNSCYRDIQHTALENKAFCDSGRSVIYIIIKWG